MRRLLIAGVFLILANAVGWGALMVTTAEPTVAVLTADIKEIDSQIAEAKSTAAQFDPGAAIGVEIQLELAVLATTRAMLDQKRRSWLRGISLVYRVDGSSSQLMTPEELRAIEADQTSALAKATAARSQVALYSGGLVQALALIEEHTNLATAAADAQRIAMARIGIALPAAKSATPAMPVAHSTDDGGAL